MKTVCCPPKHDAVAAKLLLVFMQIRSHTTTHDLPMPNPGDPEWLHGVHSKSPHACKVWKSQFPSLVHKSMWYAFHRSDLLHNIRSLMHGIGRSEGSVKVDVD